MARVSPAWGKSQDEEGNLDQYKSEIWGPIAILMTGIAMAMISWRKWPDLIVDFGQQAYIPWQISEGQVLYRDIHYLYGPLSSYLHAGVLTLFSQGVTRSGVLTLFTPGIMTLVWFNLFMTAGLTALIYFLMKKLADPVTANFTSLTFLAIFAFGQYVGGGNFNFICAYVYDLPHGLFFSFLNLYLFIKTIERPTAGRFILHGFLTGCIFLTKPEVFLAVMGAQAVGFYLMGRAEDLPKFSLPLFGAAFLVPLEITLYYFSQHMPWEEAMNILVAPWLHIFLSSLKTLPLYQWVLGTDALGDNLIKMAIYFAGFTAMVGLLLGVARAATEQFKQARGVILLMALVTLLVSLLWYQSIPIFDIPRALPLILLVYAGYLVHRIRELPFDGGRKEAGTLVFTVFAFLLLLKMFFNVKVSHYGFALAMPATLILVKALIHDLPAFSQRSWQTESMFRVIPVSLIAIFLVLHVQFESRIYNLKGYPVAQGSNMILDYLPDLNTRGQIINAALTYLEKELKEGEEFASFPDAIMINYLAKRKSPLTNINLNPAVWMLEGDHAILKELEEKRPAYIVLVDQKFPQFQHTYFGKDFGRSTADWIKLNYTFVRQFGDTPFSDGDFGIQILKRNPEPTVTSWGPNGPLASNHSAGDRPVSFEHSPSGGESFQHVAASTPKT